MNAPEKLGRYDVKREVGRGGMGVVYQAHDPQLDRVVAIKVLPVDLAGDPERLARFEREARVLASLNHPNVGSIYGLESDADGTRFLVLEYLDGPTLADRLRRGPLGVAEAVDVFGQIATALEVAHESGIIHRDLKPANIKLVGDGEVKVLDFGLAKDAGSDAAAGELSHSPTLTVETLAGVILGTAAYMSPEQARGKPLDRRTDIFSFGCVLYEALTGRALFAGETVSDTIARILEREPDWAVLPGETPERLRRVLRRCLEKDARKRQRDIGDVRLALEEIQESLDSSRRSSAGGERAAAPAAPRRSSAFAWAVAAVAVLVAAWSLLQPSRRDGDPPGELVRFTVTPPPGASMRRATGNASLSPDGRTLLCNGQDADGTNGLWVRDLASTESRFVPHRGGSSFWSPDGEQIGFWLDGKIRVQSPWGGESRAVCDAASYRGGSWGASDIVFAQGEGPVFRVPVGGGTPEPVTVLDESRWQTAHRFPTFLPDGETFLYVSIPGKGRLLDVWAGHVDGGAPVAVTRSPVSPVYAEPGYLLFQRGRELVAQAFDVEALAVSGDPIGLEAAPPLSGGVGLPALSASRTGHLAFLTSDDPRTRLVWTDGDTGEEIGVLPVEPNVYENARVSPDGRRMAVVVEVTPEESDIWILELDRMVMTRFTSSSANCADPVWSPDGDYLVYSTNADGPWNIYRKPVTRSGPAEPLVVGPAPFKNPLDWSPDGTLLLYEQIADNMDLWLAPTDGSGEPYPYVTGPARERSACFSPDGRWVAYVTSESGSSYVLLESFPVPTRPHRVSIEPGDNPAWEPDGKAIRFESRHTAGRWQARASFETEPRLRIGVPEMLYELPLDLRKSVSSPDGRVLRILPASPPREASATVVLNWARQLTPEER